MKKVTTNITLGQILFILFSFFMASFIFFYLGAKFGPDVLDLQNASADGSGLLPDEKLAQEIKALLKSKKHDFMFDDVLSGKQDINAIKVTPPEPIVKIVEKIVAPHTELSKLDEKPKNAEEPKVIELPQVNTLVDEQAVAEPVPAYSLQIGSFSDKKGADKALSQWLGRGYQGHVVAYQIAGKGQWYRVELGQFVAESDAVAAQQKIMNKFKQSVRVISR